MTVSQLSQERGRIRSWADGVLKFILKPRPARLIKTVSQQARGPLADFGTVCPTY